VYNIKKLKSGQGPTKACRIIKIIIQFFIIYVPTQQPKGQLQTQHSLDTGNYIIYKPKLQTNIGGRK
jgi:hypothetical protein